MYNIEQKMSRSRSRPPAQKRQSSRGRPAARTPPRSPANSPPREPQEKKKGVTVWIGGLPTDIKESEITDQFSKFGEILDCRLKTGGRGPPFAFVEHVCMQDAEEAVRKMDQSTCFGAEIKVQLAGVGEKGRRDGKGKGDGKGRRGDSRGRGREYGRRRNSRSRSRRGGRGGYDRYDDRRGGRDDRYGSGYDDRRPARYGNVPSGKFKITLENIPGDMTWSELKELGKQYVDNERDVTFARTKRLGQTPIGILEFKTREDADRVIAKLDGKKIKGHEERLALRHGDA